MSSYLTQASILQVLVFVPLFNMSTLYMLIFLIMLFLISLSKDFRHSLVVWFLPDLLLCVG